MKVINYIVYKIVVFLSKVTAHVLFPNKVHGRKYLDLDEPYIVYANHISILDSIIVVGSVIKRKSFFMGKEELFKKGFLNWFFTAIGGFPVKRGTPDIKAIKKAIDYLNNGDLFTIFPEGTRNVNDDNSLMEFHNGLGIIGLKSMCKLVPCYIDSPGKYKMFKRFNIYIGEPIDLKQFKREGLKKENLNKLMVLCRQRMEKLIPKY